MSSLKVPAIVTVVGSLILGVLQVLNETVFQPASHWHAYIAIALVFGAQLGLRALSGGAFQAALKLPQWANVIIGGAIAAVTLLLTTDHSISAGVHGIIAGVLTVIAGLGFGQPGVPTGAAALANASLDDPNYGGGSPAGPAKAPTAGQVKHSNLRDPHEVAKARGRKAGA